MSHEPKAKAFPQVKFLNYVEKKRILITGGAGFVGSHLVDRLMLQVINMSNFRESGLKQMQTIAGSRGDRSRQLFHRQKEKY